MKLKLSIPNATPIELGHQIDAIINKKSKIAMIRFLFFFFPIFILAQNIDMYISLIDEGQMKFCKRKIT